MHQLAMEAVRGSEYPEHLRQLGQPVHVLLAEVRLERVGAVALELLAVYQPSNSVTRTPRALASFTTTCERTS